VEVVEHTRCARAEDISLDRCSGTSSEMANAPQDIGASFPPCASGIVCAGEQPTSDCQTSLQFANSGAAGVANRESLRVRELIERRGVAALVQHVRLRPTERGVADVTTVRYVDADESADLSAVLVRDRALRRVVAGQRGFPRVQRVDEGESRRCETHSSRASVR